MNEYELFHDESMINGFWHGMLLVPMEKKDLLLHFLKLSRENTNYFDPISLKQVKKRNRIYSLASAWIQLGVCFLRSNPKTSHYPIFLGALDKGKPVYKRIMSKDCCGLKFILFRDRDNHKRMQFYSDHASKIETTFRIGLKGGLHFLGNDDNPMGIIKFHFDGHEHLLRNIDRDRIVGRLYGLRDYCMISDDEDLIDDRSSDHRESNPQSYDDCQLLQLTDLLVGSFRTVLGEYTNNIHNQLAKPVNEIISRYQQGPARMNNSRWRNSFCMSQCSINSNDKWEFNDISSNNSDQHETNQMRLF